MQDKNWIRCPYCGHKFFVVEEQTHNSIVIIEHKCHSCKSVVELTIGNKKVIKEELK